ncbi:MAG TPA: transaldolase [Candidatus Eisenbacteria bacterium]|jgi:transaldolase
MTGRRNPAQELHELGQSVWLDTISDGLIQSGELAALIRAGSVYGVTSNPTIFMKAIGGDQFSYPAEIVRLAGAGASPDEIYDELSIRDIVRTADLLAETYRRGTDRDGFVSLEVRPSLAHDTDATIAEAKRLWARVGRPNLLVKVPATQEGIPAFETLIAEGVSVNVTLLFSRPQFAEVARAYRRGLERRLAAGGALAGLHSVASLFVSRLDTSVDKELESRAAAATDTARRERLLSLRGAGAVANALDVWEEYRAQFVGPGFEPLRSKGGRPQWLLWASTGTKNPAYSDLKYVEELAGPDTINTMPQETLTALLDHGRIGGDRLGPSAQSARETRRALAALGISLEEHCTKLLADGVRSFAASFDDMMAVIRERSAALAPRR